MIGRHSILCVMLYRHCGNDRPKWVQPLEEGMSSNLQDFSREQLSPDFIARFSTDLFMEEIEEWFKYATESVIPMYEQVSQFTSKESSKEFTKQTKIMFIINLLLMITIYIINLQLEYEKKNDITNNIDYYNEKIEDLKKITMLTLLIGIFFSIIRISYF